MTKQSTTPQGDLKYLLKILLCTLRYELLRTSNIRDKVGICDAIQDCAAALGQFSQSDHNAILDLTDTLPSTQGCCVKIVAEPRRGVQRDSVRLLALIDGQSTYLRTVDPDLCAVTRRAIETSAKSLHIDQIIPEHLGLSTNGGCSFLLFEELSWPEVLSRPERDTPTSNLPIGTADPSTELLAILHEQIYGIEISAAEVCAAIPLRFPNLPEELDLILARQTYEEGRHARLLLDAFVSRGGDVSLYSPSFRLWDSMLCGRSLIETLCIEHIVGEGYALGYDLQCIDEYRKQGMQDLADIHVSLHADEIMHVTDGVQWFNRLAGDFSDDTIARLEPDFAVPPPPDPWFGAGLRRRVGFTKAQISRQRNLMEAEEKVRKAQPSQD